MTPLRHTLPSALTFFDRPILHDYPAFSRQLVAREASNPHHKVHGFSARAKFIAGAKHLSSHGLIIFTEEAALICGHEVSSETDVGGVRLCEG